MPALPPEQVREARAKAAAAALLAAVLAAAAAVLATRLGTGMLTLPALQTDAGLAAVHSAVVHLMLRETTRALALEPSPARRPLFRALRAD